MSTYALWQMVGKEVGGGAIAILTTTITILITFFGEIVPKVFASHNSMKFAGFTCNVILFFNRILKPISWTLLSVSNIIEKRIEKKGYNLSVQELQQALEITTEKESTVEEKDMLKGIVNFGILSVKQVMRSRMDLTAIDVQSNFHELMDQINKTRFSRLPVYRETIDKIEGILYIKDVLPYLNEEDNFQWQRLLREVLFVPESKKIDDLFRDFQSKHVHMAIVVDEYGGTEGMITMEDIIEEIVGEINDEFDEEHDTEYKKIDSNTHSFEGKISLNDFCKILEVDPITFDDVKGESESLGGLLLEINQRLPNAGEEIEYDNFHFTVDSAYEDYLNDSFRLTSKHNVKAYAIEEKILFLKDGNVATVNELEGEVPSRKQRLVGEFTDDTGSIELVWFQGARWIQQKLKVGVPYVVFGKPSKFGKKLNVAHPEVEPFTPKSTQNNHLNPVYNTTEKLKRKYLDSRAINKMIRILLADALPKIQENIPPQLREKYHLIDKKSAIVHIHFPKDSKTLQQARYRLKFEELFYIQLRLIKLKIARTEKFRGLVFDNSQLLNSFYEHHLPFQLTNAQKKVIKEIYSDFRSGKQMNRLVQGDVGSGKTIVAFLCMLIAISNGAQCAFMAPTEILAEQHYEGLSVFAKLIGVKIARLTGSSKQSERKPLHTALEAGVLDIVVGTHALIEDKVKFKNLGLAVIDEQHRFGVAQRARLWKKGKSAYPHVLVMTATPIPRTLAMTLYGDLDISVIDELPMGRKPIKTQHMRDSQRIRMFAFVEKEIKKGRQVYIVYPLIEESEKMDYKDLMDGYESIARRFPDLQLSILHGRMKSEDKDFEMKRFVQGETQIMVATTVVEVGVNVPNASVMVIENAERFGLSQLHQLRGRVGRGAEQSYCILMTGLKLSNEAKTRISTMVETNDGFKIAETDLRLRGPGDLMGTRQSGALDLLISDLASDGEILKLARDAASDLLKKDPDIQATENVLIKQHIDALSDKVVNWSRIS
ncbi:recG [Symbiodinium microadriaticum]|nr:recG [Symbiodinium microadriaticum]